MSMPIKGQKIELVTAFTQWTFRPIGMDKIMRAVTIRCASFSGSMGSSNSSSKRVYATFGVYRCKGSQTEIDSLGVDICPKNLVYFATSYSKKWIRSTIFSNTIFCNPILSQFPEEIEKEESRWAH